MTQEKVCHIADDFVFFFLTNVFWWLKTVLRLIAWWPNLTNLTAPLMLTNQECAACKSQKVTGDEVDDIIARADKDNNGWVTREEVAEELVRAAKEAKKFGTKTQWFLFWFWAVSKKTNLVIFCASRTKTNSVRKGLLSHTIGKRVNLTHFLALEKKNFLAQQSINPIKQTNQSIKSINQSINQSIRQSNQSIRQSNQSIQSINQSRNKIAAESQFVKIVPLRGLMRAVTKTLARFCSFSERVVVEQSLTCFVCKWKMQKKKKLNKFVSSFSFLVVDWKIVQQFSPICWFGVCVLLPQKQNLKKTKNKTSTKTHKIQIPRRHFWPGPTSLVIDWG